MYVTGPNECFPITETLPSLSITESLCYKRFQMRILHSPFLLPCMHVFLYTIFTAIKSRRRKKLKLKKNTPGDFHSFIPALLVSCLFLPALKLGRVIQKVTLESHKVLVTKFKRNELNHDHYLGHP